MQGIALRKLYLFYPTGDNLPCLFGLYAGSGRALHALAALLPTRTVPMGITALLNFDPSANAETNTINMMAAADKVSTGLITYAARDSEFDGKRIRKGEIMALENGKIVATSTDLTKATYRLARSMCKKDSSFVTIISGCDVSDEEAEKLTEIVKAKCPNHVEVSHIRGGQPVYYYMISVE